MPGAWEKLQQEVLVAILTRETVTTKWAIGFRQLSFPGTATFLTGMPFDHARNSACENILKSTFTWLFFLDDDIVCPPDTVLRLMAHNKDIISGLYFRRSPPLAPVMMRLEGEKANFITQFKTGDIVEADFVGAGCLLIHRRVIEKVQYPWFDWRVDRRDLAGHKRCSEDFAFCESARQAGFKIYVDTSIKCDHCGLLKSNMEGYAPLSI